MVKNGREQMPKISLWKEDLLAAAIFAALFIGAPLFCLALEFIP